VAITLGGAHPHAPAHQSAHSGADRRTPRRDHGAVEDDAGERLLGVGGEVVHGGVAAALLLPVDDERGPHRKPPGGGEALHGGQQHEEVALVVAGTARIEVPVAFGGRERRAGPQGLVARWLHVVVAVHHHPRRARVTRPGGHLAQHQRLAGCLADLGVGAGPAQLVGHECGGGAHVRCVVGARADARHAQQCVEAFGLVGGHRATLIFPL